jgi:hypothetical protein
MPKSPRDTPLELAYFAIVGNNRVRPKSKVPPGTIMPAISYGSNTLLVSSATANSFVEASGEPSL